MSRTAIILAYLLLTGCSDRKFDARTSLRAIMRDCDAQSVRYQSDASGPVREFTLTCEAKP